MLTHYNILNNGNSIGDRLGLTPHDAMCVPPPLFHCFGCVLGYMATATHGAAIVFPSAAFDPRLALEAAAKHDCTGLYGVPTMFAAELDQLASGTLDIPEENAFGRMRTGIAAGSSVPAELMRRLHRQLNLRDLTICYGMTETSPVSCMTTASDPLEKRVETVGRLLPHIRAKVVDPHTRQTLGVGQRGELAVSGYSVMKGYWGDEAKTREALVRSVDTDSPDKNEEEERTFMLTGDEASIDAEGYVKITGRIKDLIIRGGENVHPLEIEDCILGMRGVSDVSVVGVKDERLGEVVAAFVIRAAKTTEEVTEEDVREWVRGRLSRHLSTFAIIPFPPFSPLRLLNGLLF
jgi:acyl-CoA synthetase (AMP-forming)/AMP-acid ligase II